MALRSCSSARDISTMSRAVVRPSSSAFRGLRRLDQMQVPHLSVLTGLCRLPTLFSTRLFASKQKGDDESARQHEEWVKFQQSIKVDGFETGQQTTVNRPGRRKRRTRKDEKLEQTVTTLASLGGGEYPALRYSQEETERLLAQAYAAMPERAGKRGTRRAKRNEKRWHLVRQVRKKYKYHMAEFQKRKMQKRSLKVRQVKGILAQAPEIQARDKEYQARVFERWSGIMNADKQG